jgi:hypothetical protein
VNSIANDVAEMESEIAGLRSENAVQRQMIAVLEFENASQKQEIERLRSERDHFMRRSDAIKVLLDQAGSSLVAGIQKFNASEREIQEKKLGVGDDDKPRFLSEARKLQIAAEK